METTDIGWAVRKMRDHQKVRRAGWNGKGMWIALVDGDPEAMVEGRKAPKMPCIGMFTAQGNWQPGWLCSQADLLADDWELVA